MTASAGAGLQVLRGADQVAAAVLPVKCLCTLSVSTMGFINDDQGLSADSDTTHPR